MGGEREIEERERKREREREGDGMKENTTAPGGGAEGTCWGAKRVRKIAGVEFGR